MVYVKLLRWLPNKALYSSDIFKCIELDTWINNALRWNYFFGYMVFKFSMINTKLYFT